MEGKIDKLHQKFNLLQRSPEIWLYLVNNKELEPHKSKSWKLTQWNKTLLLNNSKNITPTTRKRRGGKSLHPDRLSTNLSFVCLPVFKMGDSILLPKLWDKGLFYGSLGHNNGRDSNCRSISLRDITAEIQIFKLSGPASSVSTKHIPSMFQLLWLKHHQVRC